MGNLRKSLLEMHFKAQISKIINLDGKCKKIGHFEAKISKNHYFNRKSKEIIISNPLLRQNWQKSLLEVANLRKLLL